MRTKRSIFLVIFLMTAYRLITLPPVLLNTLDDDDEWKLRRREVSNKTVTKLPSSFWNDEQWNRDPLASEKCFYVEDVCHHHRSNRSNRQRQPSLWFYRPTTNPNETNRNMKRQPELVLRQFDSLIKKSRIVEEYRFEHLNSASDERLSNLQCQNSTIENHLVLFSLYNTMLGEFYVRGLYFLWRLYQTFPTVVKHSQIYLHLHGSNKNLLESQYLFTEVFVQQQDEGRPVILDFAKTFFSSSSSCRCMKRVIFCGYRQAHHQLIQQKEDSEEKINMTILEPMDDYSGANWRRRNYSQYRDFFLSHTLQSKPEVHEEILWYRRALVEQVLRQQEGDHQSHHNNNHTSYRKTVASATRTVVGLAQRRVRRAAASAMTTTTSYSYSTDGWIIVGLAQRSGRRRWRDLKNVQQLVQQSLFPHKILLVTVNLDGMAIMAANNNSEGNARDRRHATTKAVVRAQLIAHGALDALVGIHGAQLTQAIWMRAGSLVVELLPYIPDGIWGGWTKTTHEPTPLGIIFDGTDLNHVGYPLGRTSAPYCYNNNFTVFNASATTATTTNRCLGERKKETQLGCWCRHRWDDRDFVLPAETLEMILRRLLIVEKEDGTTHSPTTAFTALSCQDYRARLGKDFVLYNINCAENGNSEPVPHHYYWNTTA